MTEETGLRIATALESIALTLAILLPGDEGTQEPEEMVFQTQEGPMVRREGRLVPFAE